jgi:hypothetical protein
MFPGVEIKYPDENGILQPQNVRDFFICPLCLRVYHREYLELPNDHPLCLTAEHVPPEEIGGKKMTITCRPCNTKFGGRVDSQLVKQTKRYRTDPLVKVQIEGSEVHARLRVSDKGEMKLEIKSELSDPAMRSRFWETIKRDAEAGNPTTWSITFSLAHNEARRRAALFKSAYLLLFHYFGYCYALPRYNSALVEIMRFILDPDKSPTFGYNAVRNLAEPPNYLTSNGVFLIKEPRAYASFAVLFHLKWDAHEQYIIVYMPIPGKELPAIFSDTSDRLADDLTFEGRAFDMDWLANGGVRMDPKLM